MTPIVVPAIPSVITAMLSRRCGASRFTSRAADPQKSRDRMFGAGLRHGGVRPVARSPYTPTVALSDCEAANSA